MPSRPRGSRHASTRSALVLLVVTGIATGCSGPAPAPTSVRPTLPTAGEVAAEKAETEAKAAAEAKASAETADAQFSVLPGVEDAVVRIGDPTADEPLPAITFVQFVKGTPADQLSTSVTAIVDALGASGLALDHVELTVERFGPSHTAIWTGASVRANLAREAQLWVQLIEANSANDSTEITHEALDPLRVTVGSLFFAHESITGGAAYLGLVDACIAAGVDPATATLEANGTYRAASTLSTPLPAALMTAVEQVDILDYVTISSISRVNNETSVQFLAADGAVLSPNQQLALLGPLEHFGLLTDDLTVTLETEAGERIITLWPVALPT